MRYTCFKAHALPENLGDDPSPDNGKSGAWTRVDAGYQEARIVRKLNSVFHWQGHTGKLDRASKFMLYSPQIPFSRPCRAS